MESGDAMKKTFQRYDIRTYLILVDSYEQGILKGQYYNLCRAEHGQFESMTQLILKLEYSLDVDSISQKTHKLRTFYSPGKPFIDDYLMDGADGLCTRNGKAATFTIRIAFRCNASWQGTIMWAERKMTRNFRSVLELLALVDGALEQSEYSRWEISCVTNIG